MRITNSMIFGNSLNNIQRNVRHLNNIVTAFETAKRIQRPSDDPLISGRALRFRTILAESAQFERNTELGLAWMEVSESTFENLLSGEDAIMRRIGILLNRAANGINENADIATIQAEIRQAVEQISRVEINQTYMGRYVFSGFFSTEPPMLTHNIPGRVFNITQTFNAQDVERTLAMHRASVTDKPDVIPVNILKLPYTGKNLGVPTPAPVAPAAPFVDMTITRRNADGTTTALNVVRINSQQAAGYRPPDDGNTVHFLYDTGELVFGDTLRDNFGNGLSVSYQVRNLEAGQPNPLVYFDTQEWVDGAWESFNTQGEPRHDIYLEISTGLHVPINSHARDILTDKMFADFRNLLAFTNSLQATNPEVLRAYFSGPPHGVDGLGYPGPALESAVTNWLIHETGVFKDMLQNRLNNMLEAHIPRHMAQAQSQHTHLGSRMARMDMIAVRLEEETVMYRSMLSDNEDTCIIEAGNRRDAAQVAFNNALNAIARFTQLSLADFINR